MNQNQEFIKHVQVHEELSASQNFQISDVEGYANTQQAKIEQQLPDSWYFVEPSLT